MNREELKKLNKADQEKILHGLGEDVIPKKEDERIELILKLQEKSKQNVKENNPNVPISVSISAPISIGHLLCPVHNIPFDYVSKDDKYEKYSCPKCGRNLWRKWN